jgi:UDP-N-acetylglucosamine--N-acetylmuramyl-(pentapeptide) pyrophosphoryl-undecaprenol N-acetylglucosamine transferase
MSIPTRTILFTGGGSGGHIFPNLAILERLREKRIPVAPHFLISDRPLDAQIVKKAGVPFTILPAEPVALRPDKLLKFYVCFKRSEEQVRQLIARLSASAMVATGGFVSGPAATGACRAGVPVALVNLDAVPGRANKFLARKATETFSVYPTAVLPRAQTIGLPLRRAAMASVDAAKARWELGLRPDLETVLVFAGSQGGASINQMMIEMCHRTQSRKALADPQWQVLHLSGFADRDKVQQAYDKAQINARVEPFCNAMGLAWAASSLAIARAGAGTVGEAWANAVPTVFLPYPYHKDEHQRFNAEPLVNAGAALMFKDRIDAIENVTQIAGPLTSLMQNSLQRTKMREALLRTRPQDGAETVALWLAMAMGLGTRK